MEEPVNMLATHHAISHDPGAKIRPEYFSK
jgi:hypothetical protein